MKQCAICNDIKCRCADCYALIEKSNKWWCDIEEDWCENVTCCLSYDEESECGIHNKKNIINTIKIVYI